jgi:hypothetical protein
MGAMDEIGGPIGSVPVASGNIGLGNVMGAVLVAALNLAMFRGAMQMLAIPAIAAFLVLLDVALARLLIWRRPLRPFDYGFIVTGFAATMATLPFNNDPHILGAVIGLYRDVTGDARIFRFNSTDAFVYWERTALGAIILALALCGGAMTWWARRRLRRPADGIDLTTSPDT